MGQGGLGAEGAEADAADVKVGSLAGAPEPAAVELVPHAVVLPGQRVDEGADAAGGSGCGAKAGGRRRSRRARDGGLRWPGYRRGGCADLGGGRADGGAGAGGDGGEGADGGEGDGWGDAAGAPELGDADVVADRLKHVLQLGEVGLHAAGVWDEGRAASLLEVSGGKHEAPSGREVDDRAGARAHEKGAAGMLRLGESRWEAFDGDGVLLERGQHRGDGAFGVADEADEAES